MDEKVVLNEVTKLRVESKVNEAALLALKREYDELYRFLCSIGRLYPMGEIWLEKEKLIPDGLVGEYRIDRKEDGKYVRLKVVHVSEPLDVE